MNWMLLPFKRTLDFAGRSRRREYWLYLLFWLVLFSVCVAIDVAFNLGGAADGTWFETYDDGFSFNIAFGTCALVFVLATLLTNIALGVRRLHDLDKSGLLLLIGIIPLFGQLYLLAIFTMAGRPGPNRYGPDPRISAGAGIFA